MMLRTKDQKFDDENSTVKCSTTEILYRYEFTTDRFIVFHLTHPAIQLHGAFIEASVH